MPVRLYLAPPCPHLHEGAALSLPPEPARHVQVLRLQPGEGVTLFGVDGVEWPAEITRMGRQEVDVVVHAALPPAARELPVAVTLAIGMPANERMDALVEKATELGVARIQPLQCARSVLKLSGERANKRQAHWQQVAISAAEQSGRTRVPEVAPVTSLEVWLSSLPPAAEHACHVLSFAIDAQPAAVALNGDAAACTLLSGPEGGLAPHEEDAARARGFTPLSLGPRILRADTAPLAALAYLGLRG